mgnify:CR=1 FL=1
MTSYIPLPDNSEEISDLESGTRNSEIISDLFSLASL